MEVRKTMIKPPEAGLLPVLHCEAARRTTGVSAWPQNSDPVVRLSLSETAVSRRRKLNQNGREAN
jgi:hypothetical protein